MQSTVNLELTLTNQIQLSPNSTTLTFYVPSTRATIVVTNANFPEGVRTSVQYIAAYDTTQTNQSTFSPTQLIQRTNINALPTLPLTHVLSTLPVLPVKPTKKKRSTRPIQPLTTHELPPSTNISSSTDSYPFTPDYRNLLDQMATISTLTTQ